MEFPNWYSPHTGIFTSKHPPIPLPNNPTIDAFSFLFSHKHHNKNNTTPALIDSSSGFSIPYSNLLPLIKSIAFTLHHDFGISQYDVVLLSLPNSIYFPILFLSVVYLGAIVTTLSPLSTPHEITRQLNDCNVRLAFTIIDMDIDIDVILVPQTLHVSDDPQDDKFLPFYYLISRKVETFTRPFVIRQDDTMAILYSSGTTGTNKGVVLTHRNFIAMMEHFVRFEANSDHVYLAVLPMFHVYGLSLFVVGLLSSGSTVVVMCKFDVDDVVRAIDRYKVTHFPAVPPILVSLTKRVEGACGNALKSLKQVSSGAAPLTRKVIDAFVQALPHVDLIQGYGMTETTAVGTRGFNTEKYRKYSSVGLLAPNMQAKVVDCQTRSFLPPGSIGELLLRGPGVMKGYLNNDNATRLALDTDGWLRTGDIVYFDRDGYLYIHDRLKEIIKYKGFQIAPADLEAILISHHEILDVAVTGASDEVYGEIPVAFVVRAHGSTLTQEAVTDYVAKQVAPYKKVRKVVFIHSIPKSPAGKLEVFFPRVYRIYSFGSEFRKDQIERYVGSKVR
ncbi:hypothetical protein ACFE04_012294 [Oxalis oulophora]